QRVTCVLGAIEKEQDAAYQHRVEPVGRSSIAIRNFPQLSDEEIDRAIDRGQSELFFGPEVRIDRPPTELCFDGDVLHRHLLVAVLGEEPIRRIEDGCSRLHTLAGYCHGISCVFAQYLCYCAFYHAQSTVSTTQRSRGH